MKYTVVLYSVDETKPFKKMLQKFETDLVETVWDVPNPSITIHTTEFIEPDTYSVLIEQKKGPGLFYYVLIPAGEVFITSRGVYVVATPFMSDFVRDMSDAGANAIGLLVNERANLMYPVRLLGMGNKNNVPPGI